MPGSGLAVHLGARRRCDGDGDVADDPALHRSMTVSATRKRRYKLEDLLAEMPGKLPRTDGWDEMKPVGREAF